MAVTIKIEDGLLPTPPYMSAAIVPGTLTGQSFTPSPGNTLHAGTTYDFKVDVQNTGGDDTEPPLGTGPTGPFVREDALVGGGVSPSGTSSAYISNSAGFPQLILADSSGGQIWSDAIPPGTVYGYNPNGEYFIVIKENPRGTLNIYVQAAEMIGTGPGRLTPGALVYQTEISATQGPSTWASSGLGFVPTRDDVLYLTWSTASGTAFKLVDLRPNITQRESLGVGVNAAQAGQVLFSPSGDVMALIGQPAATSNNEIKLYTTPDLARFEWRRRGLPVQALPVQLPFSLYATKPNGWEAITIRSGTSTVVIDSPTPALPAVAVYLWVDSSTSMLNASSARQYPSSMPPGPSAYIDRIGARAMVPALVDANWRATLPPPGEHFCAVAEAFTTAGTTPADPRVRTGNVLDLAGPQIAQRNLAVV